MYTEPQEVSQWVIDLLEQEAGPLGIGFVGFNDNLVPQYPAVIVTPGGKQKIFHATHIFNVNMEVVLTVYHAKLDISHKARTREDLELVTKIENLLEQGEMNMNLNVNFAYIAEVAPGTIRRPKGELVVGTRMILNVLSQKGFPYVP